MKGRKVVKGGGGGVVATEEGRLEGRCIVIKGEKKYLDVKEELHLN